MPQIKPIQLERASQNVPDVQQASPVAFSQNERAVQELAGAGMDLWSAVKHREQQQEVSDSTVQLARKQVEWTQKQQEQIQKGTLNVEEFGKAMSDDLDAGGDKLSSQVAKMHYQQSAAQLKMHLLDKGITAQGQIAGDKAKAGYLEEVNLNSSTLINDPSSFEFINNQLKQNLQARVDSGGLPAKHVEELKIHTQEQLAKSAVEGWARSNPEEAKRQLDSGQWDKYIDGRDKLQLYGSVKNSISAREADAARIAKKEAEALAAEQDATRNDFLIKLDKGELSAKEVLDSNLDPSGGGSKEHYINLIDKNNKEKLEKSDPHVMNDLTQRLVLEDGNPNKITDQQEILKHLGKDISINDGTKLLGLLGEKNTPQGAADSLMQKTALESLKIKYIKNPLLPDPKGMEMFVDAQSQAMQYSLTAAKDGKSKHQIWSPTLGGKPNPDYFMNHISAPDRTIEDITQSYADTLGKKNSNGEDMVQVINPNGVTGRIPKSKLAEKLKMGYKEVGK